MGALLGNICSRGLLLGDLRGKSALAWDGDLVSFIPWGRVKAVLVSQSVGESTIEVTLFEVKDTLLTIGNVFGKEIVEVIEFQSQENAATVCESGGKQQVEKESAEASTLRSWGRRSRGRESGLCRTSALGKLATQLIRAFVPCPVGDGLGTVSGGTADSEDGVAGVGAAVVGGLISAKNLCRELRQD